MAVAVRLGAMLVRRRMALSELSDRVGVPEEQLRRLRAGEAMALRFATLDALCRELGCQPGDLLEWSPAERLDDAEG